MTQMEMLRDMDEDKSVKVTRSKPLADELSSSYEESGSGSSNSESESSSSSSEYEGGRRPRRAAAKRKNYKEVQHSRSQSSDSEKSNDELLENLASKEIKLSPSKQEVVEKMLLFDLAMVDE